jgi:uncharacterized tellurite resistance protein B-like protein
MDYKLVITRLYFLLIHADGIVNDKELASARQMMRIEELHEEEFDVQVKLLKTRSTNTVYFESITALRKLDKKQQIRIVAWLCVVANADGFMDRTEWQLIYKIYHRELQLPLNDIFTEQRRLNKLAWENTLPSFK